MGHPLDAWLDSFDARKTQLPPSTDDEYVSRLRSLDPRRYVVSLAEVARAVRLRWRNGTMRRQLDERRDRLAARRTLLLPSTRNDSDAATAQTAGAQGVPLTCESVEVQETSSAKQGHKTAAEEAADINRRIAEKRASIASRWNQRTHASGFRASTGVDVFARRRRNVGYNGKMIVDRHFDKRRTGMTLEFNRDEKNYSVVGVLSGSQADELGVGLGWQLIRVGEHPLSKAPSETHAMILVNQRPAVFRFLATAKSDDYKTSNDDTGSSDGSATA
jgi:hypothetical protein